MKPLKFKDNIATGFKNYKGLFKKESGCFLKIFHHDRVSKYMKKLDDYIRKKEFVIKSLIIVHFSKTKS